MTKAPIPYVIDPGTLLKEIKSPTTSRVLAMWRSGELKPATSRPIIEHSLNLFIEAGIPAEIIKVWALWLSHPEKSTPFQTEPCKTPTEDYIRACTDGPARGIITHNPERFTEVNQLVPTFSPTELTQ